jgi:hypothetical protein
MTYDTTGRLVDIQNVLGGTASWNDKLGAVNKHTHRRVGSQKGQVYDEFLRHFLSYLF